MTATSGLVSVLIPVYNGAKHLTQAIESVLQQDFRSVEIIAIDDGSTDESPAVLKRFSEAVIVISQPNSGVAAARNAGIERAKGEFLAFLDQDDWWHSEKLSKQVALFRVDDRIGLVHTAVSYYDEATDRFVSAPNPVARPEVIRDDCFDRLLLGNAVCNSSVVVRRSIIDAVGSCDIRILGNTVADYDLWLRIARVAHFAFEPHPLTTFRLHAAQGHKKRIQMLTEELKVLLWHRPQGLWLTKSEGRYRLAELFDELGVAYIEAGQISKAREYFGFALKTEFGVRRTFRCVASHLPGLAINTVRQLKSACQNKTK